MSVEGWMLQFAGRKTRDEVRDAVGAVLAGRGVLARLALAPEQLSADGTAWCLPAIAETAALPEPDSWDLAYTLRDGVPDLLSAEPIVPVPGMGDDVDAVPDPRAFGGFSRGDHIPESDPIDWALAKMNVRQAWDTLTQRFPGQRPGEGTIVGHPDTGYTDHPELITSLALDLQRGRNFKDSGQTVPVDPLTGRAAGHGTATASVMVSAGTTQVHPGVFGIAPGASLAPLRVLDSVVHFSWGNLSKALYHAADSGCHVVSMSLGGAWGGGGGRVLRERPLRTRRDGHELVDDIHPGGDLAENGVSPAGAVLPRVIEEAVVLHVDEELRGGGVRLARARHRDGATLVLETVVALVLDSVLDGLLLELLVVAAALGHEARDHAVEDRSLVVASFDVLQEVGDRLRRLVVGELDLDIPKVCLDDDDGAHRRRVSQNA
mgnify:CR=1 FL=1